MMIPPNMYMCRYYDVVGIVVILALVEWFDTFKYRGKVLLLDY